MKRLIQWIVVLVLLGTSVYLLLPRVAPCLLPIPYSIASVDSKFHLTKQELTVAVSKAAKLWNDAEGKILFVPVESGGLTISAVYDYRQQTRDRLHDLGINLDKGKQSFQSVKSRYDVEMQTYQSDLAAYNKDMESYKTQKADYQKRFVDLRDHATADERARLEQDRLALNVFADRLNTKLDSLNAQSKSINGLVSVLNQISTEEADSIGQANQISSAIGGEYEAGFYEQQGFERRITLFSFQSNDELVRLIAHELGHALGLPHVDDPKAVMYRLNDAGKPVLTQTDKDALVKACALWPPKLFSSPSSDGGS
jgi:hypothetical protein